MDFHIYKLSDPRTQLVKYVGATTKPLFLRLANHIQLAYKSTGKKYPKDFWIRDIVNLGLCPLIESLEVVGEGDWTRVEKKWVTYFRKINPKLFNISDGGPGYSGGNKGEANPRAKLSNETIRKIRDWDSYKLFTKEELGLKFGVSGSYISNVVSFKSRKLT